MSFATVPRDGKIFDEKTADCLNAQISLLDNTIDNYKVKNLAFPKRVDKAESLSEGRHDGVIDKSFYVENIYCMRLEVNLNLATLLGTKWEELCTLPVDIPYDINGMTFDDDGMIWYFKIEKNKVYITGTTYKPITHLYLNLDLILLQNPLIL